MSFSSKHDRELYSSMLQKDNEEMISQDIEIVESLGWFFQFFLTRRQQC